jgi:ketosteroid isomerase-like protein
MDNRETIQAMITAFDKGDTEGILNLVTDDFVWVMQEKKEMVIEGKENLRNFFSEYNEIKIVGSTTHHIIMEGNHAAVDGILNMEGKDASPFEMNYCDIYEFTNGKVSKLISYIVKKI